MMRKINLFLKRVFDITSSFIGLIILSPLFLIIAVLIKIDTRGPIIFKQSRLGKRGKEFKIWKFRTMINNVEGKGTGVFTNVSDPRITRMGKFLRRTSLDEIPQLFNVLFGSMSVVGPRPPVTYHPYKIDNYPEEYVKRFDMKPGITGYAQVIGRNTLTWEERFELDKKYISKFNLILDMVIIIKTFFVFSNKKDIYDLDNKRKKEKNDV